MWMLYSLFLVIPQHLNSMCQCFRTLYLSHLHRSCEQEEFFLFNPHRSCEEEKFSLFTRPMKVEQTQCSETSAYKIQTPGNHPHERMQQSTLHARHSWPSVELQVLLNLDDIDTISDAFNHIHECKTATQ